ncbi:zinc-finger homeodomain protein 8-like [Euphorbia lathyris]|uniref:zinc-finger homeodomain protein 8-like n=1 Tax=Euphorbia lathyris TaxID=212925 RepID=UPI0033135BA5
MDLTLVPYQPNSQSPFFNLLNVKYKECMKNHAASIGGHANDGCGEFLPLADQPFTCAACGCHRNFHRREGGSSSSSAVPHLLLPPPLPPHHHHHQFLYNAGAPSALKKRPDHEFEDAADDDDDDDDNDRRSETPEREEVNMEFGGARSAAAVEAAKSKRFRTKFTPEQKEKMLEFAEKIGWRINRNDDVALNLFCNEIGVKRNVLKVWMHNNKNAHRRGGEAATPPSSAVASAAAPPSVAPPQSVN